MNVVDTYFFAPGQCALCENSGGHPVDTLVDNEYNDRRIYICENCVREMGSFYGLVDERKIESTQKAAAVVEAELRAQILKIERERDDFKHKYETKAAIVQDVYDSGYKMTGKGAERRIEVKEPAA